MEYHKRLKLAIPMPDNIDHNSFPHSMLRKSVDHSFPQLILLDYRHVATSTKALFARNLNL